MHRADGVVQRRAAATESGLDRRCARLLALVTLAFLAAVVVQIADGGVAGDRLLSAGLAVAVAAAAWLAGRAVHGWTLRRAVPTLTRG